MARNFNSNQNRHLYVASAYADSVTAESAVGTITVKAVTDNVNKGFYFIYKGADTVLKSPFISAKDLGYAKATKAEDMRVPFKSQLVKLSDDVNGGALVSGQDYILRIELTHWVGMSENDKYFKEAAVHATAKMTTKEFYEAMVKSLNLCFSREIGASKDSNPYLKFEATDDGILITEKEQPYTLGLESVEPVLFDAQPTTIYADDADVIWGEVEPKTAVADATTGKTAWTVGTDCRGNGPDMADLEYFSMGERGDQYRMVGWPNVILTKYLVDPSKEYKTLDLHFAFTDTGVNSYKSDKEVTIAVEKDTDGVLSSIITAINNATGLNIQSL